MENLDYGIIGNCRSAALVSKTGSIEWCCLPDFDSPSVFAKLLDDKIGGSFEIQVSNDYVIEQRYETNTAVLITRFTAEDNIFELHDFMPRYNNSEGGNFAPPELVRYVRHVQGRPRFTVQFDPRLEYSRGETTTHIRTNYIVSIYDNSRVDAVFLYTSFNKKDVVEGNEIELTKNGHFLLAYNEKILHPTNGRIYLDLERTKVYWLNWSNRTPNYRKYNAEIQRSAITLKLLSYDRSGAVLAAATTSLPETIGEERNWDYRFCWIRDASMVVKVMGELGHKNVVKRYLQFIVDLNPKKDEKFQIMYGINKERELKEQTLDHLSGYEDSRPVRIGNAAHKQKQNDIYGILMNVIYEQLSEYSTDIENGEELWEITKGIARMINLHWQEPDKGIWEFRGEDRHFTFSKLLCWVAIDRAVKVAQLLNKRRKIAPWMELAEVIKRDIHEHSWNEEVGAFTQSYDSTFLDASVLLMQPYGFIDAKDPKFVRTVHAIEEGLSNDGLLYRYKNEDDFGLPSSSFTICTFWFIDSLFKIGEEEKAKRYFDGLLSHSNHLGLFSEDIDFKSKRLLGNFPQAYSHLALIECAMNFSDIETEEMILESMR